MPNSTQHLFESIPISVFSLDKYGVIKQWNNACTMLTGCSAESMLGTSNHWLPFYTNKRPMLADLVLGAADKEDIAIHYGESVRESLAMPNGFEGEGFFPQLGDGKWLRFTANPVTDNNGDVIGSVETIQDITHERTLIEELRQSKERYKSLYLIDSATRFQNALSFELKIKEEIANLRPQQFFSIAVFEITDLRTINETYGRSTGDQIIKSVSRCIKISTVDLEVECFRYGGGRFYVVTSGPLTEAFLALSQHVIEANERYVVFSQSGEKLPCALKTCTLSFSYGIHPMEVIEAIESKLK